jgi:hypothetical protein
MASSPEETARRARRPASRSIASVPQTTINGWVLDRDAIDRIIDAVGTRHARTRDRIYHQLPGDLLDARGRWLLFAELDSDKDATLRAKRFDAITKSAKKLKKQLLQNFRTGKPCNNWLASYGAREIASRFDEGGFDEFLTGLEKTIEAADALMLENKSGGWVRLPRSPKEWFAAEVLPFVFERNFGRAAGTAPNGPYVRFAVAVMHEMSIPFSAAAVSAALKDVRRDRPRRQRKLRSTTLRFDPRFRVEGWGKGAKNI